MAASGVGALFGGVYLATRQKVVGIGKIITFAPTILGIGLIAFFLLTIFTTFFSHDVICWFGDDSPGRI